MGFLEALVAQVLEYFVQKLIDWGIAKEKQKESDDAIDAAAKTKAEAIANAKSDDDFDNAAHGS